MKRHQDRIRAGLADVNRRLAEHSEHHTGGRAFLHDSLRLLTDARRAYAQSGDADRRRARVEAAAIALEGEAPDFETVFEEAKALFEEEDARVLLWIDRADLAWTVARPVRVRGTDAAGAWVLPGAPLTIAGDGACFSAGADFRSVIQRDDGDGPAQAPHERSFAMYQPFLSVLDLDVPVIGALNGHAVGGGFGLALATDIRVGARGGRYGANFARLGLHPGMAISLSLIHI